MNRKNLVVPIPYPKQLERFEEMARAINPSTTNDLTSRAKRMLKNAFQSAQYPRFLCSGFGNWSRTLEHLLRKVLKMWQRIEKNNRISVDEKIYFPSSGEKATLRIRQGTKDEYAHVDYPTGPAKAKLQNGVYLYGYTPYSTVFERAEVDETIHPYVIALQHFADKSINPPICLGSIELLYFLLFDELKALELSKKNGGTKQFVLADTAITAGYNEWHHCACLHLDPSNPNRLVLNAIPIIEDIDFQHIEPFAGIVIKCG